LGGTKSEFIFRHFRAGGVADFPIDWRGLAIKHQADAFVVPLNTVELLVVKHTEFQFAIRQLIAVYGSSECCAPFLDN
jgi:hypothetical protein